MKYRRKKKAPKPEGEGATEGSMDVAAFLAHNRPSRPPPGARRGKPKSALALAVEDAEKRAASGEWEDATARSFVGLYALCHRLTYGVDAMDLAEAGALQGATRAATRALHVHFGDDRGELVEFIKWVWEREKGREEWAAREGKSRGRLNARIQFSASLVTDYRVDLTRRRRRR